MRTPPAALALAAALAAPASAHAAPPTPLDGLGDDVVAAFRATNVFFFAGAALVTGAMAQGGVDHSLRVATQRHLTSPGYADAALYAGWLVPAIAAPALYAFGLARGDDDTAAAGSAAAQAVVVTFAATGLLKWGTGRAYPLNGGDPNADGRLDHPEFARTFTPFGGDFGAWPSGHTSVTVALVAALHAYAPDELLIPLVGYPLAGAIGLGMVVGDRHWASDVLAGALLGQAFGGAIGDGFRARAGARGGADAARRPAAPSVHVGALGPRVLGVRGVF